MVLDTSGAALAAAVDEGVDLIKPNLREMRELSGTEPSDAREWEEAAKTIGRDKRTPVIALTMGHLGAALVTNDRILRARPLAITPLSAVGARRQFSRSPDLATRHGRRLWTGSVRRSRPARRRF